jgi:hypothetical protein
MCWRIIVYLIILTSNCVIVLYLAANVYDWKINILNPPEKQNEMIKSFDYPSSDPTGPHIVIGENGTTGLPLFSITIGLLYDGILAERKPAYLTAVGSVYPEGAQVVDEVHVGFEGASYYSETDAVLSNTPPAYKPELKPTEVYTLTMLTGTVPTLPITWNVQGDYCAYIYVSFKNGSAPITMTLQNFKVHVNGLDVIQQERNNRISLATTVTMGFFGIIDGPIIAAFLLKVLKNKNKKKNRARQLLRKKRRHKQ